MALHPAGGQFVCNVLWVDNVVQCIMGDNTMYHWVIMWEGAKSREDFLSIALSFLSLSISLSRHSHAPKDTLSLFLRIHNLRFRTQKHLKTHHQRHTHCISHQTISVKENSCVMKLFAPCQVSTHVIPNTFKSITQCLSQCSFVNGSHRGLKGENWVSSGLSRSHLCFCRLRHTRWKT